MNEILSKGGNELYNRIFILIQKLKTIQKDVDCYHITHDHNISLIEKYTKDLIEDFEKDLVEDMKIYLSNQEDISINFQDIEEEFIFFKNYVFKKFPNTYKEFNAKIKTLLSQLEMIQKYLMYKYQIIGNQTNNNNKYNQKSNKTNISNQPKKKGLLSATLSLFFGGGNN
jgi:hypothetical protein